MSSRLAYVQPSWMGAALVLCCVLSAGCATTQTGATAEELSRARDQAAPGATVYANECSKCHGARGEGLGGVSPLLGAGALPEFPRNTGGSGDPTLTDPQQMQIQMQTRPAGAPWRDPFRNAQDLYGFTTTHVPKARAAELKEGDYWAVVSFLLAAQGVSLPAGGIGPANAASIPVPHR